MSSSGYSLVSNSVSQLPAPSLQERGRIRQDTANPTAHADWFAALPALHCIELGPEPVAAAPRKSARILFWNAERCKYLNASAELLGRHGADAVLLAEMDLGMARSGQCHTTRDLGAALGMHYAFGVEFVELGLGDERERRWHSGQQNDAGLHGGGILARSPLRQPALIRLEQDGRWFTGMYHGENRVGGRIAMAGCIEIAGTEVALVAAHFESDSDPDHRAEQMAILLAAIDDYAGDRPCLVGGDFNCATLPQAENTVDNRQRLIAAEPERFLDPALREPMFALAGSRGYDWQACNVPLAATLRTRPDGAPKPPFLKIDWFFSRGLAAGNPQVVPAVDGTGTAISDHEIIAVTVRPESR